jgi:hypothetical protein
VEQQLRAIGQTFGSVGAPDPRLNAYGKIDFRLSRQISGYKRRDPPPTRVKPLPVQVLHHLAAITIAMIGEGTIVAQAIFHMIVIAFFFLLRPGEYTSPNAETTTFELQNVIMYVGNVQYPATAIPLHLLQVTSFATLEFTTQKNGVEGEIIGHGPSGDGFICPVDAIRARVRHLWENNAPPHTPLCAYYTPNGTIHCVTSRDITTTLRAVFSQLGPAALGFLAKDVSARSLRAAGAMALFCAHVDTDTIRLIGRWRSDEMLRYLHVQAAPLMRGFAARMLADGNYTLLPNAAVAGAAQPSTHHPPPSPFTHLSMATIVAALALSRAVRCAWESLRV